MTNPSLHAQEKKSQPSVKLLTDRHTIYGTDSSAPLQQQGEGGFKEDIRLQGGATSVVELGSYWVWFLSL